MFSKTNKIVPVVQKGEIKISYNNEKCFYCNSIDMIRKEKEFVGLYYCERCCKYVLLFEYIKKSDYEIMIEHQMSSKNDVYIKKTNFEKFIKSSLI